MVPIYEQLISQVKSLILEGRLKANDLLPSVRSLAAELRISALTVKKAYDCLEEEGFVVTVHGKGTYVAAANIELAAELRRKEVEDSFAKVVARARAIGLTDHDILDIMAILLDEA